MGIETRNIGVTQQVVGLGRFLYCRSVRRVVRSEFSFFIHAFIVRRFIRFLHITVNILCRSVYIYIGNIKPNTWLCLFCILWQFLFIVKIQRDMLAFVMAALAMSGWIGSGVFRQLIVLVSTKLIPWEAASRISR